METDAGVTADRRRLRRLAENLVRNAVEHGGHDVTVTVDTLDDGRGFAVSDDGVEVPESAREAVHRPGFSTGGVGLASASRSSDGSPKPTTGG